MSFLGRVRDSEATYPDPLLGVNLHAAEEDLQAGETPLMKNMVRHGRLANREGSTRLIPAGSLGLYGVRGGHKFYTGGLSPNKYRVIAYDTKVSTINDAGIETVVWGGQTADLNTDFTTWSITDQVYVSNGTDPLLRFDGTVAGPVGSTNIRSSLHEWVLSGTGSNHYYVRLASGGDPSLADPTTTGGVVINTATAPKGTMGALALGEWSYGDVDSLGYSTIYVRLNPEADPDTLSNGAIQLLDSATVPGVGGNPASRQIIGVADRLFAITSTGIERTDPRDPTVWSVNSSWATMRPSQSGSFIAHIPHMVSSEEGSPIHGALAMTENSYYFYTGTDFGDDVTAGTPSSGEDASIQFVDNVGAFGPKSVKSVPGIGTFWLTNNRNIFFVPVGQVRGEFIGTRVINTGGSTTEGLESLRLDRAQDAWLAYSQPYLMVGFPVGSDLFPTVQYWLNVDLFRVERRVPVWYGPMLGQTLLSVWEENAQGDDAVVAGEGNPATGVMLYRLREENVMTDDVGLATNPMDCAISTYLKSGGSPSREKLVQGIEVEMSQIEGTAFADVSDLSGVILPNVPIQRTAL